MLCSFAICISLSANMPLAFEVNFGALSSFLSYLSDIAFFGSKNNFVSIIKNLLKLLKKPFNKK